MNQHENCLFCQIANKKIKSHFVFEDDFVSCFLDHDPINIGHCLIVTKKHFLDIDEMDEETLQSISKVSLIIMKAIKKAFRPDGITIMQNGGIFNELGHYHQHVFPRYKDDGFRWESPNLKEEDVKNYQNALGKIIFALKNPEAIIE